MNYAKCRINVLSSQLDSEIPNLHLAVKVETFLMFANTIRDRILRNSSRITSAIVAFLGAKGDIVFESFHWAIGQPCGLCAASRDAGKTTGIFVERVRQLESRADGKSKTMEEELGM